MQKIGIKFNLTGYGLVYMSYLLQILLRESADLQLLIWLLLCFCCIISRVGGFGQKVNNSDKYVLLNKLHWICIFW